MKKLFLIVTFLVSINSFAQLKFHKKPYLKGEITLKDGTVLKGIIKLNNSAFDVRFKENEKIKKSKKIKFKEINEITTFEDSLKPRKFYYKHTNKSKFLSFVELIHKGKINIYINASVDIDLFYSKIAPFIPTDEWMNNLRKETIFNEGNRLILLGKYNHFFFNINTWIGIRVSKTDYFLQKNEIQKLTHIGSSGNFLYKNFKKTTSTYFNDCPKLVEKINAKKLKLKQLVQIPDKVYH